MSRWVALGEVPLGSFKASNQDDAIHMARDLYGWDVWSVEWDKLGQWTAYRRHPVGEVEATDKVGAFAKARKAYGADCLSVQSAASYAIDREHTSIVSRWVEVKNRRATDTDRGVN